MGVSVLFGVAEEVGVSVEVGVWEGAGVGELEALTAGFSVGMAVG